MSWSFSATGRPGAVAAKAAADLAKLKCVEPEETIKNKVLEIIATSLATFPPSSVVQVEAGGHQSTRLQDAFGVVFNQLSLTIKPLYGFVE
jgi:hypothetical protein